jgi:hypothetical protein
MKPKEHPEFEDRARQVAQGAPVNSIKNADGTHSTHKMVSREVDGHFIAHPTIVSKGDKLVELSVEEATKHALKTGEYKEFGTDVEAKAYAEGAWKDPKYHAREAVRKVLDKYAR